MDATTVGSAWRVPGAVDDAQRRSRPEEHRRSGVPRAFGMGVALLSAVLLVLPSIAAAQETCPAVPVLAASDAVAWLDDQEGGPHHGHTIARHVGKTVTWLRQRLRREPAIPAASSFGDKLTAARVVRAVMRARANCGRLMRWARGGGRHLELTGRFARAIGTTVVRRTGQAFPARRAIVVLQRTGRGYGVLTAYRRAERPAAKWQGRVPARCSPVDPLDMPCASRGVARRLSLRRRPEEHRPEVVSRGLESFRRWVSALRFSRAGES